MNRADGIECYQKALRQGQRDYREKMNAGQSPFLPVLDDILQNVPVENQIPLGQVEIPLDLLVGTKTSGRTAAFASNFMPLLGLKTEFATKWINLCVSHLDEGIRDPITCYEYMGRFYVQEGNKRVSVLKYFDASSITGNVTRVVPQYSDDPAVQMYYEFMHFYPVMQNYLLTFTKPGSYARLQKILGKAPDEKWTGEDRTEVLSLYNWVKKAFLAHGGARLQCTVGDVLLLLLRVYTKEELANLSPSELSEKLDALWDDVLALQKSDPVQVSDKPAAPKQTGLLDFILPGKHTAPSHLKVAFVHERTPGTSSWTSQHEFGRTQLDTVFEGKVETAAYFNAVPGKNADALVEQAITDGADVVFTTSPKLVGASLRAAVRHPQVHILNCSMEMPYASIRTYYTRVYEAKFITGAIAGAMAGGDRIGYVADYPSFGVPANINAFALGARMTNPNVRIDLQWTCLPDQIDPLHVFTQKGITVISGRDAPMPNRPQREFGTFLVRPGGVLQDLATPFWHWGQFYENVIRTVLNGGWVRDKSGTDGRAVNYWWGMNSGVMDVLLSRELPSDVAHLAHILRTGVTSGMIDPFACRITDQNGTVRNSGRHGLDVEQLVHMDYLCDAVDGTIPEYDDLTEQAPNQEWHEDLTTAQLLLGQCRQRVHELAAPAQQHSARTTITLEQVIWQWQLVRPTIDLHRNPTAPLQQHVEPAVAHLLMVLLNNAADASLQAGRQRIDLELELAGQQLHGQVRDYGPGFDPRQAALPGKLFNSSKSDGLGVGLALSHATIERLGGQLWMRPADGPGSSVSFTLPVNFQDAQ